MATRRPTRGLAEPAVGDERQPLRRDARREHRVDPLGDLVGRLEVVVLDVDDAGGDVPPAAAISPQELDLGHLAVGELEDELVDVEAEHRVEDRAVGPARQRPAEVVAEAEVRAEPDATDERGRPRR